MIERWIKDRYGNMHISYEGHWVEYADHRAEVEEYKQRIAVLEKSEQSYMKLLSEKELK